MRPEIDFNPPNKRELRVEIAQCDKPCGERRVSSERLFLSGVYFSSLLSVAPRFGAIFSGTDGQPKQVVQATVRTRIFKTMTRSSWTWPTTSPTKRPKQLEFHALADFLTFEPPK